jgi:hypothetical protein
LFYIFLDYDYNCFIFGDGIFFNKQLNDINNNVLFFNGGKGNKNNGFPTPPSDHDMAVLAKQREALLGPDYDKNHNRIFKFNNNSNIVRESKGLLNYNINKPSYYVAYEDLFFKYKAKPEYFIRNEVTNKTEISEDIIKNYSELMSKVAQDIIFQKHKALNLSRPSQEVLHVILLDYYSSKYIITHYIKETNEIVMIWPRRFRPLVDDEHFVYLLKNCCFSGADVDLNNHILANHEKSMVDLSSIDPQAEIELKKYMASNRIIDLNVVEAKQNYLKRMKDL